MKLNIIKNRRVFFIISGILIIVSILSLSMWGLKLGIDFTGGTLMEVEYGADNPPSTQQVREGLEVGGFSVGSVQPTENNGFIIRMNDMNEDEHQRALGVIRDLVNAETSQQTEKNVDLLNTQDNNDQATQEQLASSTQAGLSTQVDNQEEIINPEDNSAANQSWVIENRFESIGPVIGKELKEKAIMAIIVALVLIVIYIAWAFKKVSKPVASWKYGMGAIVALVHDVLIVTGIFSILGHYLNLEVDVLFVTGLLTVLGYSVNDTIVVYDRTRENLLYDPEDTFDETVNKSLNQTMSRSINTSLTTMLVLLALFFFGGNTIKDFALVLIFGIFFGTYSSIFVASPLLIVWQKLKRRR